MAREHEALRPFLQLVNAFALHDWSWCRGESFLCTIKGKCRSDSAFGRTIQADWMVVESSGKTVATSIRMQFWPNLCNESPPVDEGSDQIPQKKCFAPADTVRRLDDLGPGVSKPYVINIDVTDHSSAPPWSPGPMNNINLSPVFEYSDSNGHYHEQPCFAAVVNSAGIFEKGPIPPCAMLDRLGPPNP
jgi:hypothetical protein